MSSADVLSIFNGALTTLLLSIAGIALGLPLGLGLALARWASVPLLNLLVATLCKPAARHTADHAGATDLLCFAHRRHLGRPGDRRSDRPGAQHSGLQL